MPLQNRVTPFGEIIATPARGTMMGNRGVLHDEHKQLGRARWKHNNWVNCVLSFHGRRRTLMTPNRYTELFFLDEAVALAAGHRPCGECRRERYRAYMDLWAAHCADLGPATPKEVDRVLQRTRIDPETKGQRRYEAALDALPDGTFVALGDTAFVVQRDRLLPYNPTGYGPALERPGGTTITVLTPEPTVRILGAGYQAAIALA
ncbi:MAG: hypothetical protein K0Q70_1968 [Rhodospirillales bacterium]|jgi:hypothetical protein|nr:hypothetical protein [Rhodospirillales bacterium]